MTTKTPIDPQVRQLLKDAQRKDFVAKINQITVGKLAAVITCTLQQFATDTDTGMDALLAVLCGTWANVDRDLDDLVYKVKKQFLVSVEQIQAQRKALARATQTGAGATNSTETGSAPSEPQKPALALVDASGHPFSEEPA